MRLSKNFTLGEFTKSQTAIRKDINNTPSDEVIRSMTRLAENVLQPMRDHFGRVRINSGYRCLELNRALGSSDTSQHILGEAADIEVYSASNYELAEWVANNCEFDKVILEFYVSGIDNSGWVHVAYRDINPRHETYTISKMHGTQIGLIQ